MNLLLKKINHSSLILTLLAHSSISIAHDEFVNVIAKAKPAVVTVHVSRSKKQSKAKYANAPTVENAIFYEEDLHGLPRESSGSGFLINHKIEASQQNAVFILTAAHVVLRSSKIKVMFSNKKRASADIVWIDKKHDIALLKAAAFNAPNASIKLSTQKVLEGQSVLSISSSFNLSVSSSLGIVSAVDVIKPGKRKINYLQTDAVINPGSSGGPLLNHEGEVLGLISDIFSNTGAFSGVAYAVPAARVTEIITQRGFK